MGHFACEKMGWVQPAVSLRIQGISTLDQDRSVALFNACLVYLQQGSGIYISQRTSDVSERHRMLSEMGHPNHKWDSESSAFSFGRRCTQFLQEVAQ